MRPWKTKKSKYLVKDRWVTLRADTCVTSQGVSVDPYYVMEALDWVHILALDSKNNMLVVRQYRHAAGIITTEIPCGEIEPGESPLDAAKRELKEETGAVAARYEKLGIFYPNPGRYNNRIHSFLAADTQIVGGQALDETEQIEHTFVTIPALLKMIDTGEFPQGLHIASVLMGLRNLKLLDAV